MIEFFMQMFTGPFYSIMNRPYGFSEFFTLQRECLEMGYANNQCNYVIFELKRLLYRCA